MVEQRHRRAEERSVFRKTAVKRTRSPGESRDPPLSISVGDELVPAFAGTAEFYEGSVADPALADAAQARHLGQLVK
jgi:hypothetical protein